MLRFLGLALSGLAGCSSTGTMADNEVVSDAQSESRDASDSPISTCSERIAFARVIEGEARLFLYGVSARDTQALSPGRGTRPAWSPDGHFVGYEVSNTPSPIPDLEVRVAIQEIGGSPSFITPAGEINGSLRWSTDGLRMAYVAGFGEDVVILDRESGNRIVLSLPAQHAFGRPRFSPDGARILFVDASAKELWTAEVDGSQQQIISNQSGPSLSVRQCEWSPDGRRIACQAVEGIAVMNADGSDAVLVTDETGVDRNVQWSPDGTRLAFDSERTGNREVFAMAVDGTGVEQISDVRGAMPVWSPDGTTLAITRLVDNRAISTYIVDVESHRAAFVTIDAVRDFPAWEPCN